MVKAAIEMLMAMKMDAQNNGEGDSPDHNSNSHSSYLLQNNKNPMTASEGDLHLQMEQIRKRGVGDLGSLNESQPHEDKFVKSKQKNDKSKLEP